MGGKADGEIKIAAKSKRMPFNIYTKDQSTTPYPKHFSYDGGLAISVQDKNFEEMELKLEMASQCLPITTITH